MTIICKNCGNEYTGNFCNMCGQSANVQRLSWKYVIKGFGEGLFQPDKYKFSTIRELLVRPGDTIREFIEGKRIHHYKPFTLLLFVASIYLVLHHVLDLQIYKPADTHSNEAKSNSVFFFYSLLESNFSIATILTLPMISAGSYIAFKKQGYNFLEHIVLNAYLSVQRLIFGIFALPLLYFYNETPEIVYVSRFISIIDLGLLVWGYSQFFYKLSFLSSLFRTILTCIIFLILLTISIFLVIIVLRPG